MNNLQRIGDGTAQIWRALPVWGKVVAVIVGAIGLFYSFSLILGLFFIVALGIGLITLLRWLISK